MGTRTGRAGYSGMADIARHLGRTPAAVAGLLKRSLKQLRARLHDSSSSNSP